MKFLLRPSQADGVCREKNVSLDPIHVGLFGADGVMSFP